MNTAIKIFSNPQFGDLRVMVSEGGEIYFLANDVAKALGYANPRDAVATHCKSRGVVKCDTPINGVNQEVTFINEANFYLLVMKSRMEGAEKFQEWASEEVFPSIRKHGLYATEATVDRLLSDPDTAIEMLTRYKEERSKRLAAEQEATRQRRLAAACQDETMEISSAVADFTDGKFSRGSLALRHERIAAAIKANVKPKQLRAAYDKIYREMARRMPRADQLDFNDARSKAGWVRTSAGRLEMFRAAAIRVVGEFATPTNRKQSKI